MPQPQKVPCLALDAGLEIFVKKGFNDRFGGVRCADAAGEYFNARRNAVCV